MKIGIESAENDTAELVTALPESMTTVTFKEQQDLTGLWGRMQARMKDHFGEALYKSWLRPLQFSGISNGQAQLHVPTRFMREWVMTHYAEDITRLFREMEPAVLAIDLTVRTQQDVAVGALPVDEDKTPLAEAIAQNASKAASRWSQAATSEHMDGMVSAPLDPRFTFENFIIGKPNELAHAAARRVAEANEVVAGCNPLFLYGGVGLGKTHLMHAIAWHIRRTNPNRRVVYLSAEKFMYQFIRALRFKEAMEFKEYFRSVDVLMVDDVQFISGKDSTQEEFFHTFNALVDQNKQLVISADRSPSDLDGIEERIRSRLGWGLVADLHATNYELRLGILQAKSENIQSTQVPPKVLEFLAHKITSNVRELEGALNRVVAHSTLVGRPITLETSQEVLQDLLRANDRRVSIEDIQKEVANHYNIKVSDMHSARRARAVARPRQVAMYLSKKLTSKSLPEIGRKFGGKDHTTVMHAVRKVEELLGSDAEFAEDVRLLTRMLDS